MNDEPLPPKVIELLRQFAELDFNERQEFVDSLPMSIVLKHPDIRRLLDSYDEP